MPVRFLVTGFGPFAGVLCNPTQKLVEWLRTQHQHPLYNPPVCVASFTTDTPHAEHEISVDLCTHEPANNDSAASSSKEDFVILSCTVLEVSADAVVKFLDEQKPMLEKACSDTDVQPVVLLHLGVDTQRNGLNLEYQACNNAQFRCPDQAGWQPDNVVIEQGSALGLTSTRCTTLPLQRIADELRAAGFDCLVSHDAGRFVCNYTYHKSLQLAASLAEKHQNTAGVVSTASHNSISNSSSHDITAGPPSNSSSCGDGGIVCGGSTSSSSSSSSSQHNHSPAAVAAGMSTQNSPCYSLFVHVPPFTVVPAPQQEQFLLQLLRCLSRALLMQAKP